MEVPGDESNYKNYEEASDHYIRLLEKTLAEKQGVNDDVEYGHDDYESPPFGSIWFPWVHAATISFSFITGNLASTLYQTIVFQPVKQPGHRCATDTGAES